MLFEGNTVKVTTKGQVTIPLRIRQRLGIKPQSEVQFVEQPDGVKLVNISDRAYRERLESLRGHLKGGISSDELMRLTRGLHRRTR